MGAVFNCEKLKAKNDAQALNEGRKLIADCRHEYGHGGYTGTFAECSGVKIINKPTSEEMCEWYSFEYWLDTQCEKWGPMLIVELGGSYYAGATCSC